MAIGTSGPPKLPHRFRKQEDITPRTLQENFEQIDRALAGPVWVGGFRFRDESGTLVIERRTGGTVTEVARLTSNEGWT